MAGNPLIEQGTLNRVRGSAVFSSFPELNITASYLGRGMISLALEGTATTMLPTTTGLVTSPEPYQMVNVSINLLRSQPLSAAYKAKMEKSTLMGPVNIITDSPTLPDYNLLNCAITGLRELPFTGEDAGFVVTLGGYYLINSDLWNLV
jgi:hypothetical protein